MTGDRPYLSSPLGRRLLAAFLLVALSSVAALTVAALVATDRGLASAQQQQRRQVADRVAAAAGAAYARAGGWPGADLTEASRLADAAGAQLAVRDAAGELVRPGHGMGPGMMGMRGGGTVLESPVTDPGRRVGAVRLTFTATDGSGRSVAWSWVAGAAVVALLAALAVSWYVARRLTRPLITVAGVARRFAGGDRTARARLTAPGELGEVAHAFDAMADEVVRTDATRRRLAADVAHELRTPLAGLQAGLEELRDGLRPADPERLAALHDQSLRLGRIVRDLADLSAAEAATVSLEPVGTDLTGLARAALAAQEPLLTAAGLRVTSDLHVPAPVRADPDRLHQAVTNVLANAARYGRPGDRVHLATSVRDGEAVLRIADTGPGIPPDELPYAFDRMWRGRDAQAIPGTGIGLTVVRELVAAHGGSTDIASPPGEGVTVTIRLPLS
ncbi:HAMP domain-containing sensor histidine kinase [Nucisporomicrobium flavum]|uniref:HAMP domain-containing sensor histidine kinase n=1 Tax=Nucisporomicrobium flavum TaxID=2785915 RepID=UPI003C2EC753